MELSLGFSPCPNDTFMFDAIANEKITIPDIKFTIHMADIETLNSWALEGKLDITKFSFATYLQVLPIYQLLQAGSALGKNCGPLLIANGPLSVEEIPLKKIGIPGKHTTANLLFTIAYPTKIHKEIFLFSEIEEAILQQKIDAGIIIHENRFTYEKKGLVKIMDLGEYWEQKTGCPIPLGGIGIRKNIPPSIQNKINTLIQKSILLARQQYPILSPYIINHAQALEEKTMRDHINLYVNDFSVDLGTSGKKSIELLRVASQSVSDFI